MSIANQEKFEFGIYTFGEIIPDPITGKVISAEGRIQNIIETAKLADEVGLDIFGLGEHHRLDFAVSATPVVLAAIAQATKNIRLASATTVLGTADPVRVFEDFSTLDLISGGRAEIMAGRGAFIESFPLFGYNLDDYHELFEEKLQLLQELNNSERVTWQGKFRSPLNNSEIAPRPKQNKIPIWRGVGGTPASAVRTGQAGFGMALAILGGNPLYVKPLVEAYRQAGISAGHAQEDLKIAITSHGYIGKTAEQAVNEFHPYYSNYIRTMMGRNIPKEQVTAAISKNDALAVGGPEEIVEKILYQHELFGHHRFIMQLDICQPFSQVASAIELLATKVMPIVRREIKNK
jgi:probable LLM family oxidoreductase